MSDYLLKANIILALLYAFYRLFFYRDTPLWLPCLGCKCG